MSEHMSDREKQVERMTKAWEQLTMAAARDRSSVDRLLTPVGRLSTVLIGLGAGMIITACFLAVWWSLYTMSRDAVSRDAVPDPNQVSASEVP